MWKTVITDEETINPNNNIIKKIDKHVKKEYNYNRDYKTIDNSNLDEFIIKNNYTEEAIKKKLLKSEFDNLVAYTDKSIKTKTNYRTLNAKLNNDQELDADEIKFMDHANRGIDLFPLKDDIKVYRGLALSDDVIDKLGILKEGNYAVNKGFMSTSIDKDVAIDYATKNVDSDKKKIVFEFEAIKGTKTINLDQITNDKRDKENLFKTNTKYKILEVKKDYEGLDYYIKARIIKE